MEPITIERETLNTVLKGECSLPALRAVLDLWYEGVRGDRKVIVHDSDTGRRYELTTGGLIEVKEAHDV